MALSGQYTDSEQIAERKQRRTGISDAALTMSGQHQLVSIRSFSTFSLGKSFSACSFESKTEHASSVIGIFTIGVATISPSMLITMRLSMWLPVILAYSVVSLK